MPETDNEIDNEIERKESFLHRFGPAIFWGTMIALPAMNLAASYLSYKDVQMRLELAKLTESLANQE